MRTLVKKDLFRRISILAAGLLLCTSWFIACENPFDPLDTSEEIRGLSYVDFSLTWDVWDSDPEADGVIVAPEYFNEFGDSLSFDDKSHRVVIEFYTQVLVNPDVDPETGEESGGTPTLSERFFAFSVQYSRSDDDIRIPIEAYISQLVASGYDLEEESKAFVALRVFPPLEMPQTQLVAFYADQTVFKPEESAATEGDLPAAASFSE